MQPAMYVLQAIRDLAGSEVDSGFVRPDLAEEDSTEGHGRWTIDARKHTLRLHTSEEEDSKCFEEF
jgi:hypothetical protein